MDEVSGAIKKKKAVKSPVLDRQNMPSLARNFQGLAIHETPSESPNVSKIFADNFVLDNEEYMNIPATARLENVNKAYIAQNHNTSRFVTQFTGQNEESSFQVKDASFHDINDSLDSLDDNLSDDEIIERNPKNMFDMNKQNNKLLSNLDTNQKHFDASTQNPDFGNSRLETFSSTKSKRENYRLPPSSLKPETMSYKYFFIEIILLINNLNRMMPK